MKCLCGKTHSTGEINYMLSSLPAGRGKLCSPGVRSVGRAPGCVMLTHLTPSVRLGMRAVERTQLRKARGSGRSRRRGVLTL